MPLSDVATSCACRASTLLWLAAAVAVLAVGYFVPERPEISLAVGIGVCLFGLTLMDSAIIPLLMVVPALVTYRIAVGGTDLTVSDAALFVAFFPAAIFAQRPFTPTMRALVWSASSTRRSTLFTVIANPYRANVIEWVHAGLLTIGALVVGWSIGREGHARLALTLILRRLHRCWRSRRIVQGLTQYAAGDFSGVYPTLALRHAQERRRLPLRLRRGRGVRPAEPGCGGRRCSRRPASGSVSAASRSPSPGRRWPAWRSRSS